MPTTPLLPLPDDVDIISISEVLDGLLVRVTSNRSSSTCPLCETPSHAIHSYYRRKPLDLPCAGRSIRLLLTVKKFFCRRASCSRKIFTERIPELLEPSSRLTTRLRNAVQEIGFTCCGKGGERLASKLGMCVSDTTLLWSLFLISTPEIGKVRIVALDDWAWKKGQRYGSIIVDLETHKIIDLLPERTAESVKLWLEAHPEIDVVSRDRGGVYVDGATQGAPQAIQVCDRWHLMKNLGDAVEAFVIRARIRIPGEFPQEEEAPPKEAVVPSPSQTHREELSRERLRKRQEVCQQAKDLSAQGWSIHAIAQHLDRERKTIRKYLKIEGDWQPTPRQPGKSKLDPYREYILSRWEQGCQNGQRLLREIRAQGYEGCDTVLRAFVTQLRKNLPVKTGGRRPASSTIRTIPKTPREIRWLLAKHREELDAKEQDDLDRLLQSSEEVRVLRSLLHKFLNMVRQRKQEQLRSWMEAARTSGIPELKSFVAGLERDYDAVKAALHLPWSQGITEGKVNKLKTLKRVMYGRAGFALLRQRLLHDA
jgi:transposase